MGALIGALYAAGYTPDEIQVMLSSHAFEGIGKVSYDKRVCFYQHYEANASFVSLPLNIRKGLRLEVPFKLYDLQYIDFKMMNAFAGAAAAANYNFDNENINNSIQNCEFKNLSSQEDLCGFDGNSETNKKLNQKFFYCRILVHEYF